MPSANAREEAGGHQAIEQPIEVVAHRIGQDESGYAEAQRRYEKDLAPRDLIAPPARLSPVSQLVVARRGGRAQCERRSIDRWLRESHTGGQ